MYTSKTLASFTLHTHSASSLQYNISSLPPNEYTLHFWTSISLFAASQLLALYCSCLSYHSNGETAENSICLCEKQKLNVQTWKRSLTKTQGTVYYTCGIAAEKVNEPMGYREGRYFTEQSNFLSQINHICDSTIFISKLSRYTIPYILYKLNNKIRVGIPAIMINAKSTRQLIALPSLSEST